jgi:hypothetical protein
MGRRGTLVESGEADDEGAKLEGALGCVHIFWELV